MLPASPALPTPGSLNRASTASPSWSYTTSTIACGICPGCHYKHARLVISLRFSSNQPLDFSPITCNLCGETILSIGSKLPPYAEQSLAESMATLASSAQVFADVGSTTMDQSEISKNISIVSQDQGLSLDKGIIPQATNIVAKDFATPMPRGQRAALQKRASNLPQSHIIRKKLKRTFHILPKRIQNILARYGTATTIMPEQSQQALSPMARATIVQDSLASGATPDRLSTTRDQPAVNENIVPPSFLPDRRYSEAPFLDQRKAHHTKCHCAVENYVCLCTWSCHRSNLENHSSFLSDNLDQPYNRLPSSQDTETLSARSDDPGPQRPTSKHPEDLTCVGAGFAASAHRSEHLDVSHSRGRDNSFSGSTEIDVNSNTSLTPPSLSQELEETVSAIRPHLRSIAIPAGIIQRVREHETALRHETRVTNQYFDERSPTSGHRSA